jgi:hypothetical protein
MSWSDRPVWPFAAASSRLTTATGGRCLAKAISIPPPFHTSTPGTFEAHRDALLSMLVSAQSSIRRWYWFAKARIEVDGSHA